MLSWYNNIFLFTGLFLSVVSSDDLPPAYGVALANYKFGIQLLVRFKDCKFYQNKDDGNNLVMYQNNDGGWYIKTGATFRVGEQCPTPDMLNSHFSYLYALNTTMPSEEGWIDGNGNSAESLVLFKLGKCKSYNKVYITGSISEDTTYYADAKACIFQAAKKYNPSTTVLVSSKTNADGTLFCQHQTRISLPAAVRLTKSHSMMNARVTFLGPKCMDSPDPDKIVSIEDTWEDEASNTTTTITPATGATHTAPSATEESFQKIFSHNTAGGLFSDRDDAMYKNPDNPEADLFSVLYRLEDFRDADGNFHFKLCYPELTGAGGGRCNEWTQTSNPATEGTITGFQAISLSFTVNEYENGRGRSWGGLGRSNDTDTTLIDDTGEEPNWWSAIGAMEHYPQGESSIPGPFDYNVTQVALYIGTGGPNISSLELDRLK